MGEPSPPGSLPLPLGKCYATLTPPLLEKAMPTTKLQIAIFFPPLAQILKETLQPRADAVMIGEPQGFYETNIQITSLHFIPISD